MDDDLLNPISIDVSDYEEFDDEQEEAAENPLMNNVQQTEAPGIINGPPPLPEEDSQPQAPQNNAAPSPEELDKIMSGEEIKPIDVSPAPTVPPQAPTPPLNEQEQKSGVIDGPPPFPTDDNFPSQEAAVPPVMPAIDDTVPMPSSNSSNDLPPLPDANNAEQPIATEQTSNNPPPPVATHDQNPVQPIDIGSTPPVAAVEMPPASAGFGTGFDADPIDEPEERVIDKEELQAQKEITLKKLGEEVDLTSLDRTLKKVLIGIGWELVREDKDNLIDLDVSVFLLDSQNQTRMNEDFVFYNNLTDEDETVTHHGDNRTGYGDGDDENITINLPEVSFEIAKIEVVLSIYQGREREQNFSDVKDIFFRIVNEDTTIELFRVELDSILGAEDAIAIKLGYFTRIGANWFFQADAVTVAGGLPEVATEYGIVVAEMM